MGANLTNQSEFQRQAFGMDGYRRVTSSFVQPAGEKYVVLYGLETATGVTTTTSVGDGLASDNLQAGQVIYGPIETISVSSGVVIAYIL